MKHRGNATPFPESVGPGTFGATRPLYPGVGVGGRHSFVRNLRIQNKQPEDLKQHWRCCLLHLRPKAETGEPMVFYKKLQVWILEVTFVGTSWTMKNHLSRLITTDTWQSFWMAMVRKKLKASELHDC